jgi:alpha-galactosidase-like protein
MASSSCPSRSHLQGFIASRSALAGMLMALLCVLGASPAWAQGGPRSPAAPSAESLTQSLVGLSGQSAPLQTLRNAAAARKQHLLGLMESDPAAVLRVAIPAAVRAGFPAAIQADVEEEVALEGELQVFHEDYTKSSRYRHFLQTTTERLEMHFAKEAPTLLTGTRVRVRGVRLGQDLALNGTGGTVQALTSVAPNTFGAQKTLIILVNFQDLATQPFSTSDVQGVAFTTTSNHYKENSFQQTWLTGDVTNWFTIAMSYTVCDTATLATLAKQKASAAGYTLSNYSRHVFAFPINACGWWGMGSVGGNPSQAWINGPPFVLKVLGHEMGHNLGLYHSHALECGASATTGSCSSIEYGDTLDIMGNPSSGHFTAYQKERIGWLNSGASPPISTVSTEGLYWIDAFETPGTNPKALKILKSTNPNTYYYVEYRQALGYDSFLSGNSNVLNGVVIHLGTDTDPNSSYLLDLTPQTDSWDDPALVLGQSFTDANAGIIITPVSMDGSSASVQVTVTPLPCVRANPTVTVSPSQSQWVTAGTTVNYTMSVKNMDGTGCSSSTFSLGDAVPAGWTALLPTSSLTLSPGASGSAGLQVASPAGTADGFYQLTQAATNSAAPTYTASTQSTYVVASSLVVTVSASQATYSRNQIATLTATVTGGTAPVSGASVAFTITKANGAVTTGTATTNSSGQAVYKLRLGKHDPVGTYTVGVKATLGNIAGTASTSFQVQ